MALHRRFRPVFKKYAPRGTARFAKPLQGPFSLVAKHPQKHKNRPEIGRFSHFNPGAEMRLFSLFSASEAPEKWLCDAICRKKQLFAGSFGSRSHSFCSFTTAFWRHTSKITRRAPSFPLLSHLWLHAAPAGKQAGPPQMRRPCLYPSVQLFPVLRRYAM